MIQKNICIKYLYSFCTTYYLLNIPLNICEWTDFYVVCIQCQKITRINSLK